MRTISTTIISLPYNKFLDQSKLKAFADNKINMIEKLKFVLQSIESIVEKGENADYHHFLFFPQCFQKVSKRSGLCGKELNEQTS